MNVRFYARPVPFQPLAMDPRNKSIRLTEPGGLLFAVSDLLKGLPKMIEVGSEKFKERFKRCS